MNMNQESTEVNLAPDELEYIKTSKYNEFMQHMNPYQTQLAMKHTEWLIRIHNALLTLNTNDINYSNIKKTYDDIVIRNNTCVINYADDMICRLAQSYIDNATCELDITSTYDELLATIIRCDCMDKLERKLREDILKLIDMITAAA